MRESLHAREGTLCSLLVLFILLTITFFPLVLRENFIPFERYPMWSSMLARSSGQELEIDSPAFKRLKLMPWAEDPEVSSIAITWTDCLHLAHNLRRGVFPLWDPYTGGGVPTLDCGQTRPFNPFRVPFYFFPSSWVYSLTLLGGLVFGALGAFLWLSRRGLSTAAVTLGTGLFVLNPWVLDRLVLTDSAAYFVLPWCLITLPQMAWRNWQSIARAVLCFVLMGHSGHPEVSMMLAAVAVVVYLAVGDSSNGQEPLVAKLKAIGVVAAVTLACLTVLWLPLLRLSAIGYIYKKHAWFVYEYGWKSFIALPSDMFVAPAIAGIFASTFLVWKKIPKIWVVLLGGVILFLFPLPWLGTRLSRLLTSTGFPSIYLKGILWTSLSFLTPYGLDAFIHFEKRIRVVGTFSVGGAMLTITGLQFISSPMAANDISAFPFLTFLLLGLGLFALAALYAGRKKFPAIFLSAILLTPLAFPMSLNKLLWNKIDFRTNSVIEWVKANRPHERLVSVDPTLTFAIPPNLGKAYGIRCAEISSAIFLNYYWQMFHHPRALPTAVFFDFLSPDAFRHMGASIVLLPNGESPAGLSLLVNGTQFSAFSIPGVHGRLYIAERAAHHKPNMSVPEQIRSLGHQNDAVAIVENMKNPVPAVIPENSAGRANVVFERDDDDEVVVSAESPAGHLLVLRDSYHPGWLAFVDGQRAPVYRINGCFRGVIVSAGTHTIRFVYRPILTFVAGLISLISLLLVTSIALRKVQTQKETKGKVVL